MSDWQRFFDAFATRYDQEVFTKNTEAEIRFIVEHLQPPPGGRILDMGCGTGRHSVALARHGFRVTGVDLSPGMLSVAHRRAETADVDVEWVQADATRFTRPKAFDTLICLCEGAMCLLTADDDPFEHDLAIIRNMHDALAPGGGLLLNVLNACRHIRMYSDADVAAGRYDILAMAERSDAPACLGDDAQGLDVRERGYTPPEFRRMLTDTGFEVVGIYGGTAGAWNLQPPSLDEYELMAIARKREQDFAS